MAVFTPVTEADARAFLGGYDLGDLCALEPIAEGIQNTNYRVETEHGRFVLTLFEERTDADVLPFCLGLTAHLAVRGFPAATLMADRAGRWLGRLNGRDAAMVEWKPGDWLRAPDLQAQATAGATLARLHRLGADFPEQRANPLGPAAWRALADRCATKAFGEDRRLLDRVNAALDRLGELPRHLPSGPIHADFFPDNVLFEDDRVSAVIDFYYGCTDAFAYDLAIALSAWGFDAEGEVQPHAIAAFRRGYESVRPLTRAEAEALPRLGEAAALRFTLTRLHDRIFHDPTKLVTPKDPAVFLRRLDGWRTLEAAA
ncbi:homoserine kinase [Brevundimonas sp. PAMC22021]|uniref:homoserine kinase n=1 Tax=Brevundimonas sp. PAMC22021 TaxID=2861285 RepID=UPI001C63454C|nr:homoserine kinase [Brevundimonas sp. PAMC22021]QYF87090.1 homoserine kinase [Brevundimonas sp. PAMC22021]